MFAIIEAEDESNVALIYDHEWLKIYFAGLKGHVETLYEKLQTKKKEMLRKRHLTSAEVSLPVLLVSLLGEMCTFDTLCHSEDFRVSIEQNMVTMAGHPDDITSAKLKIREARDKVQEMSITHKWSAACVDLVSSRPELQDTVDQCLKQNQIWSKWQVEDKTVNIFVFKEEEIYSTYNLIDSLEKQVWHLFEEIIVEETIELTPEKLTFLEESTEWNELQEDLTESQDQYANWDIKNTAAGHSCIHVYGCKTNVTSIIDDMTMFFAENFIIERQLKEKVVKVRYIQTHMKSFIRDIEATLAKERVTIGLSRKYIAQL